MPSRAATIIAEPARMSIGAGRVLLKPKARAMLSLFVPTSPGALRKERPPDVGGHGGVEVDEVVGVRFQLGVDRVGHLLGERAVGLAGEGPVEVAAGESLERAHPRILDRNAVMFRMGRATTVPARVAVSSSRISWWTTKAPHASLPCTQPCSQSVGPGLAAAPEQHRHLHGPAVRHVADLQVAARDPAPCSTAVPICSVAIEAAPSDEMR